MADRKLSGFTQGFAQTFQPVQALQIAQQNKQAKIAAGLKAQQAIFDKARTQYNDIMKALGNKNVPGRTKVDMYNTLDTLAQITLPKTVDGKPMTFGQKTEWKPEFDSPFAQAARLFDDDSLSPAIKRQGLSDLYVEAAEKGMLQEFGQAIEPLVQQQFGAGQVQQFPTPGKPGEITATRLSPTSEAVPITFRDEPITQLSEATLNRADKLRTQFIKQSSDYIKIRDSFSRVQASAEDPSPAGDLALVFNFMKILDPGSVVRESEFANASNAGGVPEQVRRMYNNLLRASQGKGAFILSNNQRKDFVNRADKLFKTQNTQHDKRVKSFNKLATRQRVPTDQVTIDITQAEIPQPKKIKSLQDLTPTSDLSNLSNEELQKVIRGEF